VCVSAHIRVCSCAHIRGALVRARKHDKYQIYKCTYVCICTHVCVCVSVCVCVYYRDKQEPLENIQCLIEIGFAELLRQKEEEYCEEGTSQMRHRALINHSESASQDELSHLQAYN